MYIKIFLLLINCFLISSKQIIVDSYEELEKICMESQNTLIIFDLFDVGIEYKNIYLHKENRSVLNEKMKKYFVLGYKIRAYLKSLRQEGFVEIDGFTHLCEKLSNKVSFLCICSEKGYNPNCNFYNAVASVVNYDSYINGVLFYNHKLLEILFDQLSQQYDSIIFITSSKSKIKKYLDFKNFVFVLFSVKRSKLNADEIDFKN